VTAKNDRWTVQSKENARKPRTIVVGNKAAADHGRLKASTKPRPFHIYVGNLDIGTSSEDVKEHCQDSGIKVLECELVRSRRYTDIRAVAAHVTIDMKDKDKAFQPGSWFDGVVIRAWRMEKRSRDNHYDAWGGDNWDPLDDNE
jgi:hypothetical protein